MAKSSSTAKRATSPAAWASSPADARLVRELEQFPLLEYVGCVGRAAGTRAFLVGGPVRDILLGHESPDIDLAVESRCREFGRNLACDLGGRFVYHGRFLSGTIQLAAGRHIDVNQTRTERYQRPAALPVVKPAPIEDDLGRRDFTINAIALALSPCDFGRFLDPYDGRADVARRTVRVLHDRSFIDDPTRIFRCIRFAVRYGFAVEPHTLDLMRAAINDGFPRLLTPERILYELRLICAESKSLAIMEAVIRERLLWSALNWTPRRGFLKALARLVQGRAGPGLLFIYLLSALPVTDRFPIAREERAAAQALGHAAGIGARLARVERPSAVYRALRPLPEPALHILSLIAPGATAARIKRYLSEWKDVHPEVGGAELRALGLRPGPLYRELLDKLLFARLDGRIRSMSEELTLCRRLARRIRKA